MSINVTVSGNPVRISRGKMVTYDPSKAEFEKRRLIRLEQVRQQSKDIAENIRTKLKKEKTKCLSEIEKEGEVKLKNWQARKLLELQNQYQEVLDDIGLGHREAIQVEDEENVLVEQQQINDRVAKERGRIASERVQIEKNEENLKKAVPVQRKKLTRDFENNVAKSKSKKDKKKSEVFDSDGENKIPPLVGLADSDLESPEYIEVIRKDTQILKTCKEQQTSPIDVQVPTSDKALQTLPFCEMTKTTRVERPLDTRISERIKQRERMVAKDDYCDLNTHTFCQCCRCPVRQDLTEPQFPHKSHTDPQKVPLQPQNLSKDEDLTESQNKVGPSKSQDFIQPQYIHKSQTKWDPSRSQDLPELQKVSSQHLYKPQTKLDPSRSQDLTEPQKVPSQYLHKPHTTLGPSKTQDLTEPQKVSSQYTEKPQSKLDPRRSRDLPGPQKVPSQHLQNESRRQGLKVTQKSKGKEIPAKPKITLRSVKDRPAYLEGAPPTETVQVYDHPNRYSRSYLPQTSHLDKIDDEELEFSPSALSEGEDIKEKMRQHDIEAQIRGAVALEKEKLQREYRELLKKLPVLQKQERICEIGLDKEKYHMSRDRLEELEKKRQNRLDNAYEELFVRRRPPIVTLPKKNDDQDQPQSLNLATWDTDFDPSRSRTEQLNDLLMNLKSQKDSLLREIETTLSKETVTQITKSSLDDVKSKSTDYSRVKTKRKRSRTSPTKTMSSSRTTGPSPKKKPKLKVVKILQNTSTQTTPKTDQSVSTSPKLNTPVTEPAPCLCNKNIDDLCEIVIKIKEDEKPEVVVNPPFLGNTIKVVTEKEEPKKTEGPEPKKTEDPESKKKEKKTEEPESKKTENLSKKAEDLTRQKGEESGRDKVSGDLPKRNGSWREQLSQLSHSVSSKSTSSTSYHQLPKTKSPPSGGTSRTSTPTPGKQLDPRLLTYVKKLLNMSRASIDDLTVSAASDVSTPSHSVVETPSNNPLSQLRNVMRYFNIDAAELQKQLSYSTDQSSKHYNTSESLTLSSSSSAGQFKSCIDVDPKRDVVQQYADVTASCTRKISDLTAMIEKVREEKRRMLQSSTSSSDKDLTTTSYKELPEKKSPSQEELDKQLLNIDYNYAQKLKQLSKDQIESVQKHVEGDPTDVELLTRLKTLLTDKDESYKPPPKDRTIALVSAEKPVFLKPPPKDSTVLLVSHKTAVLQEPSEKPVFLTTDKKIVEQTKDAKTAGTSAETVTVSLKPTEENPPSPLFLDIPKLPKLETPSLDKKKKRPPPSKGMRAIPGKAPHELSTILEADSRSKIEDVPDIITDTQKPKDKSQSSLSDDVSEMETMETMLVSIGMEWAIPTLKKTREALALSSSSSGEVSLREFLSKISSSSSKSGEGSMDDTHGVSLINVDNRRTSTPIVDKKEGVEAPVFMTDSDLSSVKEHSERKDSEEKFYDLYEGSLTKTG